MKICHFGDGQTIIRMNYSQMSETDLLFVFNVVHIAKCQIDILCNMTTSNCQVYKITNAHSVALCAYVSVR